MAGRAGDGGVGRERLTEARGTGEGEARAGAGGRDGREILENSYKSKPPGIV